MRINPNDPQHFIPRMLLLASRNPEAYRALVLIAEAFIEQWGPVEVPEDMTVSFNSETPTTYGDTWG